MENFTNLYEVTKTVRFGLSQNPNKKNKTHKEFEELVKSSFDKIEKLSREKNKKIIDEKRIVKKVRIYVDENKVQLNNWKEISKRSDVIKFSREYLKVLSRKAKFDFNKGISLNFNGIKNKDIFGKLEKYFEEIINTNERLLEQFEFILLQFEEATNNEDKAHLKPNKIDFQKQFLSILRISGEWLNPMRSSDIEIFVKEGQKNEEKNKIAVNFVLKEERNKRSDLYEEGKSIKSYIEASGKQVSFAKCTLNYYTARQKPENVETQITDLIASLEIKELYEKIKDFSEEEIEAYFLNQDFLGENNKLEFFSNYSQNKNKITQIEFAQIFRPKPILASVKYSLIDRLVEKEKYNRKKLEILFDVVGEKVDIANDFTCLKEKKELDDFSLENYPLKFALDYAWENLARNIQEKNGISDAEFGKNKSIEFLKKFEIDDYENHSDLKLYSSLSFIRDELATLEHGNSKDTESIIFNITEEFEKINLSQKEKWMISDISESLKKYPLNLKGNQKFQNAKQKLGSLRGGLKNKVQKYKNLTENFKEIAGFLGRNFADLRDKLREEYQFNKISHYAVLLEDQNDKYLLALEIDKKNELEEKERNERLDILDKKLKSEKINSDDILVKKVSSFTAKTLNKVLRNKGGYKEFHSKFSEHKNNFKNVYYYDSAKHMQIMGELKDKLDEKGNKIFDRKDRRTGKIFYKKYRDKNNSELLVYIKNCLTQSTMSQSQDWNNKFNWKEDLENCKTYEDIEKVLDIKGYCIEKKYISKKDIKDLVGNENCLLLPIVNQDYFSQVKQDNFTSNKNQFTQDFEEAIIFKNNTEKFRLHPECTLFYKFPVLKPDKENHKAKILNRNMRFQILGSFGIEKKTTIENEDNFVSRNAKNKLIRNKKEYENKIVKPFNEKINDEVKNGERDYFYGIDRGIKELATLCVLDKKNEIQDFIVFHKEKSDENEKVLSRLAETGDMNRKVYRYTKYEKKSILDLTNIKVETWHCADENHPNSVFLRNAFAEIKENPEFKESAENVGHDFSSENKDFKILVQYPESEGSTALKLRMKHYQRALAYSCSHSEYRKNLYDNCAKQVFTNENAESKYAEYSEIRGEEKLAIIQNLFGLNSDFKKDSKKISFFEELQVEKLKINEVVKKSGDGQLAIFFEPLLQQFFEWAREYKQIGENNYDNTEFKAKYAELDDLDNLKRGVVANMVGTINFLMEHKKGIIVLEDVEKEQVKTQQDALDKQDKIANSHSQAEHLQYAGTETYRYLEKMLVRKFEKQSLTPPFSDLDSLNKIELEIDTKKIKNKRQFGIFYYVPVEFTSNICPECGFCVCGKDKNDKEEKQSILPEFANPKTTEEINEYSKISVKKDKIILEGIQGKQSGLANLPLIMGIKDILEIKQIDYLENKMEGNKKSIKYKIMNANSVNSKIISLLIPRLEARKNMYQWGKIKNDPFFCAGCGKNTDTNLEKNFNHNFTSADDIAAYNVAYSILYNFINSS